MALRFLEFNFTSSSACSVAVISFLADFSSIYAVDSYSFGSYDSSGSDGNSTCTVHRYKHTTQLTSTPLNCFLFKAFSQTLNVNRHSLNFLV